MLVLLSHFLGLTILDQVVLLITIHYFIIVIMYFIIILLLPFFLCFIVLFHFFLLVPVLLDRLQINELVWRSDVEVIAGGGCRSAGLGGVDIASNADDQRPGMFLYG